MPHSAAVQLFDEGLERRVGAVDRDHAGAMVLFIPGFMQRGDAWRPVAELLPERYPSTMLDHAEHSFEGRLRRDRRSPAQTCSWATRSAAGSRCARRCARPSPSARSCLVGATAGIEEGPLRVARAEADEKLASWIEAMPMEDIVSGSGSASRCSPTSPTRSSRPSAPGRLSHDPRSLALLLRTAGQGAARAGVARAALARATAAGDRRRARRRLQPRGEAHRLDRSERPGGDRGGSGACAAPSAPGRGGRLSPSFWMQRSDGDGGEILVVDAHPEARAGGHLERPAARAAAARPPPGSRTARASRARTRASAPRRRRAEAPRRCPRARRACSTGRRRARDERASRSSSRAGLKPPALASFTFTTSQASSSTARRRSRSEATDSSAAIGVDTRWRTSASSRSEPQGCSTSSRSCVLDRSDRVHGVVDGPHAVGVHPQRRPGTDRLADGGHALHVVGKPHLQLEARVALAHARLAPARPPPPAARRPASCSPAARACAARRAGGPPGARAGRAGDLLASRVSSAARTCGGRRPPPPVSAAAARSSGTPSYGSNGAASP